MNKLKIGNKIGLKCDRAYSTKSVWCYYHLHPLWLHVTSRYFFFSPTNWGLNLYHFPGKYTKGYTFIHTTSPLYILADIIIQENLVFCSCYPREIYIFFRDGGWDDFCTFIMSPCVLCVKTGPVYMGRERKTVDTLIVGELMLAYACSLCWIVNVLSNYTVRRCYCLAAALTS